jgi:riboflavin biosynthesis pyrimidine reductase
MEGLAALTQDAVLSPTEVVRALALRERGAVGGRPRVAAVMIASIDGQATVAGRSRGLGHPVDRALMRALRASADAVLVGAATVRAERYARLFDAEDVAARVAAGLSERPPLVVATRSGDVPWDVGVFAESESSVIVATGTEVELPG